MPKSSLVARRRVRKRFGRIPEVASMPNLIEVQRSSYETFLQRGVSAEARKDVGLRPPIAGNWSFRSMAGRYSRIASHAWSILPATGAEKSYWSDPTLIGAPR